MLGKPSGYIATLPKPLRNRIQYLGELQDQHDELEEKLHEEQLALQRKYEALWSKQFVKLHSAILFRHAWCTYCTLFSEHLLAHDTCKAVLRKAQADQKSLTLPSLVTAHANIHFLRLPYGYLLSQCSLHLQAAGPM